MPPENLENDDTFERELKAEEADRLRKQEPMPTISRDEFLEWRSPRNPVTNPTRLDNPLWQWLVRTGWDAYNANELFKGPSSFDSGPMWCFQRFGKSETTLSDGRIVHIGGEHEDYYDSDFYIYNDVTVIDNSGSISIFGYTKDEFAPTDFHSATLVGNSIFMIGRLGYSETRELNVTPVYKLNLDSMCMQVLDTQGDYPGWIFRHTASLSNDDRTIVVSGGQRWWGSEYAIRENLDSWSLDTHTGKWDRLTQCKWQHWIMRRVDRKPNRLWDTRQALWHKENEHLGLTNHWPHKEDPNLKALERLYRFVEGSDPPKNESGFGTYNVNIDGIKIRFKENRFWVETVVEGQLTPERLSALQTVTLKLLEQIDSASYEIEKPDSSNLILP